jgi:hypothetical protein
MSSSRTCHFSNYDNHDRTHSPSYHSTPIHDPDQHPHLTQRAHVESAAYTQALAFLQQHSQLDDASRSPDHSNLSGQSRPNAHLLPSIWTNAPSSTAQVDPLYTPQQQSRSMYQGQRGQYRNSPLGTPVQQFPHAAKIFCLHSRFHRSRESILIQLVVPTSRPARIHVAIALSGLLGLFGVAG